MRNIALYSMLLLVLVAACKKDKEVTPGLDITGTWRKASNSVNDVTYYHFTTDKYVYVLNRDSRGWKDIRKGLYQFEDGQLITSFPSENPGGSISSVLYNITEGQDTVILETGDFNGGDLTLLRDNLAPKSVTDFIKPVQPMQMFEDTAHVFGLAYYNSKLYGVKGNDKLMVYGIAEKKVVEVRTMANWYDGIEFSPAGDFWTVGYSNKMYKVNPVTGTVLFTSVLADGYFRSITYDGIYWLGASSSDGGIDKYYDQTDSYLGGYIGNYDVTDLAFSSGNGYAVQDGVIHKLNQSFYEYDKAYYIEGYRCKGIAYDNTNNVFWVSAEDMATGKYYMLQIQLN